MQALQPPLLLFLLLPYGVPDLGYGGAKKTPRSQSAATCARFRGLSSLVR